MGTVDRSHIRVKAFAVVTNPVHTHHVVWRGDDPSKDPSGFHRCLGGSIDLGERSVDAVVREIHEELGSELLQPELLGVLENLFVYDGESGHEVVFVYAGNLADPYVVPAEGAEFEDSGGAVWVEWRRLDGVGEPLPLYPDDLQGLINSSLT